MCYNNKYKNFDYIFFILRFVVRILEVNVYNQEIGLEVRIFTEFFICGFEIRIFLFFEFRFYTFWKKSNSQEMGKIDYVYEISLQFMLYLRVWVFIR